jgi:hypothetical protein
MFAEKGIVWPWRMQSDACSVTRAMIDLIKNVECTCLGACSNDVMAFSATFTTCIISIR